LIDIKYKWSMNRFEEFYGNSVTFSTIEQESYIELKTMVFEFINPNIKFRKFNRENNVLTLKADMLEGEFEMLKDILDGKVVDEEKTDKSGELKYLKFFFIHDFEIVNVRILSDADLENAGLLKEVKSEDALDYISDDSESASDNECL